MTLPSCILLLDVGGTFLKSALGTAEGGPIAGTFVSIPMPSDGSREEIAMSLRGCLEQQQERAHALGYEICALGAAVPGPFDYEQGIFLMKHKFASVYGCKLTELVGFEPQCCRFVHDVNAALLGEIALSAGRSAGLDRGVVALVTLGTGLGFAHAVDGRIQTGPTGSPAVLLYKEPYRDGILEDYVSARGILRSYKQFGGADAHSVKEIADLAECGDIAARRSFSMTARYLCEGLAPIAKKLGIGTIIFAGQISKSFHLLSAELKRGFGESIEVLPSSNIGGTVFAGVARLFSK